MSGFADRLKQLRLQKGKSQYEIADELGISRSRYAHLEQGRIEPDLGTLEKLAAYFGVDIDYLVTGRQRSVPQNETDLIKEADEAYMVPVIGIVRGGEPIFAQEDIIGYLPAPAGRLKNGYRYFYLRVVGDSMVGDGIFPGSYVLVRHQDYIESGRIGVVLVLDTEEATIKRVRLLNDRIFLIPSNPRYDIQSYRLNEVRIIGEVIMVLNTPGDQDLIEYAKTDDTDETQRLYTEVMTLFRRAETLDEDERRQVRLLMRSVLDFVDSLLKKKSSGS